MAAKNMDQLEIESRILKVLAGHTGRSRVIGMGELYEKIFGKQWHNRINDTKKLRTAITALRREGVPICSDPSPSGGGYYNASTPGELNAYLDRDKRRAINILAKCAAMRQIALPELLGQLQLELEGKKAVVGTPLDSRLRGNDGREAREA